jgi:hypothetical protein
VRFRIPITKELKVYFDKEDVSIITQLNGYNLVWENYELLGVLRLRQTKNKIVQEDLEKILEQCLVKSVPIKTWQDFLIGCGDEISEIKIFEDISP